MYVAFAKYLDRTIHICLLSVLNVLRDVEFRENMLQRYPNRKHVISCTTHVFNLITLITEQYIFGCEHVKSNVNIFLLEIYTHFQNDLITVKVNYKVTKL